MGVSKAGPESGRRALDLLFSFTEQRPVASVKELAAELSMPIASAHRYLNLLHDYGLVTESGRGRYHLTMRVAALGRAAAEATPLVTLAEPVMRELAERIGETVLLIRLVHGQPVCANRIEARQKLRLSFEIGQPLPALRGASARVLLSAMSLSEREDYIDEAVSRGADLPVSGREKFLREIAAMETRTAESLEEIDEGVWSVATGIREGRHTVGTLSAPCPTFRLDIEKKARITELVELAGRRISATLSGGTDPGW